jgi:hypothetical protein
LNVVLMEHGLHHFNGESLVDAPPDDLCSVVPLTLLERTFAIPRSFGDSRCIRPSDLPLDAARASKRRMNDLRLPN